MKTVLFLCSQNSARSQMAEGFVNARYDGAWKAESAGVTPGQVHPMAVRVMSEIGIDLSGHRSKSISEMKARRFDVVATVCDDARDACPFFPGDRMIHRTFLDPASAMGTEEERLVVFRNVRDEISDWIMSDFWDGDRSTRK